MADETGGSITQQKGGAVVEEVLFTYSEEERQQNEINRDNAQRVFSPEFVPFYVGVQKRFGLTDSETKIYGFVRFYTSSQEGRFYFTDEQLSEVVGCSSKTVSRSIKRLKGVGLLKIKHKIKAGGGVIRFVTTDVRMVQNVPLGMVQNVPLGMVQNVPSNKNKIKENKINNNNTDMSRSSATASNRDVSLKEKYQAYIRLFNEAVGSKHRGDPKSERQFIKLYKGGARGSDFARVLEVAVKDEFVMGKNDRNRRYLTPEFITRPEKFDHYLSLSEESNG